MASPSTIDYPITMPTSPAFSRVHLRQKTVVSSSESPFTLKQQVVAHPGERWELDAILPPMKGEQAEKWKASLISLRGIFGTFILGLPETKSPHGSMASVARGRGADPNSILRPNGSNQAGDRVLQVMATGYGSDDTAFKAGDYIEIPDSDHTVNHPRLHKILKDAVLAGNGIARLDIWPALRKSPDNSRPIKIVDCQGTWRLTTDIGCDHTPVRKFDLAFSAIEDI